MRGVQDRLVSIPRKIICHLRISFQAERPPPCHVIQQELLMAAEGSGEYF